MSTPERYDQEFWDARYRSRDALWSGNPNPQLVAEAADLEGGRALDIGSGEGADAIWLAQRGWQVTAVDLSTVALERAAAHAAQTASDVAGRIRWLHADVMTWEPGAQRYDLISAQFMQLPPQPRAALFGRLAAAVAPGGRLLIVGHHPSDLQTTVPRPPRPELFFTAGDVAASLDPDAWEILVETAAERSTSDPQGRDVTIHDALLHARRR